MKDIGGPAPKARSAKGGGIGDGAASGRAALRAAPQQREWTTEVKNLAATVCIFGVGYCLLVLLLPVREQGVALAFDRWR